MTMNKYLPSLLLCLPLISGGVLVTVDEGHAGPGDRREHKQDVRSDRREVKQDVRHERREHYERQETGRNVARTAVAVGAAAAIVNAATD
jgi:hypothetical protein